MIRIDTLKLIMIISLLGILIQPIFNQTSHVKIVDNFNFQLSNSEIYMFSTVETESNQNALNNTENIATTMIECCREADEG